VEIYKTTGKEDVPALCRAACEKGASLVVSAGGDGTVVGVANGLVNGKVPMGILPLGTGNDLARALLIPLKLDEAVKLLAGENTVADVDAMKVGDRYYFSNVSVGVSPEMMEGTKSSQKKRFGLLAYIWTMIKQTGIFARHGYILTIDGQSRPIRAAEILVANTTLLEKPPYVFGSPDTFADGQLEVYVVTARTFMGWAQLVLDVVRRQERQSSELMHLTGHQSIRIESQRSPQLLQADGEVLGHTPVDITLVPRALHVVMPRPALPAKDGASPLTRAIKAIA
jgi:diacylglycerol kinase family enzyme